MLNKRVIAIEGNIGVGKTTFIEIFKKYFPHVEIVLEPIDIWTKIVDSNNENILQKFYNDTERWAYTFQNIACITRMITLENTLKNSNSEIILVDRSLGTDKNVFEQMLYDNNKINDIEHKLYNLWYDFYYKYVRSQFNNFTIYLKCNPNTALNRIKKRNRIEEKDIQFEYLEQIHNYHEKWLNNSTNDVLIIDCDKDFEHDEEYQLEIIKQITNKFNIL